MVAAAALYKVAAALYKEEVKRLPLKDERGYLRWTRPRVIAALLLGAALAIAALAVDTQLRHERERIILTGEAVPAKVVEDKELWPVPITVSVLRYTLHGREESTEVTHAWGTRLEVGQPATVFVERGRPGRVALKEGHSSLGWQWTPFPLATFGGLALILPPVSIASFRRYRRWQRLKLDDLDVGPPRIRHGRGVVRRHDVIARVYFGLFAAGTLGVLCMWAFGVAGETLLALPFFAPFVIGLYLPAFSSRVEITKSEFVIHGPMSVTRVPRRLITGCGLQPDGTLAVVLTGHPPVTIPVGISVFLLPAGTTKPYHRPQQLLTMARIRAIVEALPEETGTGSPDAPVTRTRYVAVGSLVLAFLACAWAVLTVANQ